MAAKRNAIVELFWRIHPRVYRWTGGRIGGKIMNLPVLLLTTTGRRSGARIEKALGRGGALRRRRALSLQKRQ